MAFKPTRMNQVKSILKDVLTGEPIKKTSRIYGVSKNTVKKCLAIFKSSGVDISQMDQMSDEAFHRLFYEQPSSDSPEYYRNEKFKELLPSIINELGRHGVTRETIYKQYILDYPTG